jgi:predicted dehydrogenase
MKKMLKWGFLSTARINRALIPPLQISPRNTLTAVASRDHGRAIDYANQNRIPVAVTAI